MRSPLLLRKILSEVTPAPQQLDGVTHLLCRRAYQPCTRSLPPVRNTARAAILVPQPILQPKNRAKIKPALGRLLVYRRSCFCLYWIGNRSSRRKRASGVVDLRGGGCYVASPRIMNRNYKDTLNLPRTAFPMKANLAAREPEMLKAWEDSGLTSKFRNRERIERCLFCMMVRLLPMAMSTWAPRLTKFSKISW